MKKPKRRTAVLFLNIPANIKAQYKSYCAKRETTMTDDLVKYMEKVTTMAEKGTRMKI